jgi:hypothetical protein
VSQIQERPFANKTEGELFMMSEFLQHEIEAMSEKNALVQAEMRFRALGEAARVGGGSGVANQGTLDSYEEQSKAYAIRVAMIGIGVVVAIVVVVWIVA